MNCEWVKQNATLLLYDELPDDARHELEQHVTLCKGCASELEETRLLHRAFNLMPVVEPTPNLLASSRMKLQEALEHTEQNRGLARFTLDLAGWMRSVRFQPALAMVLVMLGFGGGIMATYKMSHNSTAGPDTAQTANIAQIQNITQDPATNQVKIQYNKLVPDTAQGQASDPEIQRLLLYAAHNNYNSGVRLDATNVLTQNPQDQQFREALIFSLRYDQNPGVRLKALDALKQFVKQDVRVRDAILEALLKDSNKGVRTMALQSLTPVTADTSVRLTLEALAAREKDDYIRGEARRTLATLPTID